LIERHHPEGRFGPKKPYIGKWTIPLTPHQHKRIHVALRAEHLDFPADSALYLAKGDGTRFLAYLAARMELHTKLLADMLAESRPPSKDKTQCVLLSPRAAGPG